MWLGLICIALIKHSPCLLHFTQLYYNKKNYLSFIWHYLSWYYEMYLYNENVDHYDGFLLQNMVYQWYNKEKGDFLGCLGTNLGPPFFFQPSLQQSDKTWDAPMPSLLFWFLQACQILLSWKAKENISLEKKSLTWWLIF